MTTRVPIERRGNSYAGTSDFLPSPYWGTERSTARGYSAHNPMMDGKGRLWITQLIRPSDNPTWCRDESDHPSAKYFPIDRSQRQLSYYDTKAEKFVLIDTCYMTHHLQFADDENDTLWLSGSTDVVGWLNTRLYDETGDERAAQGWCPTIVDTNGDGRIAEYTEPDEPMDPTKDMRLDGFAYGIIPNPVDGSIWIARRLPVPGSIVRLELGDDPPETCIAEVYEPPFENANVDPSQWGHGGRGIDVDRNGLIWTALGGSGHLASFDRSKCSVLDGPTATGQHCPEGWTLYQTPGPQMKGVTAVGSADFHYYNWVDQFNTLGLGENVPIANGTNSDSLLALLPETGEWVTLRVPYPQGFYTRGLDATLSCRGHIPNDRSGLRRAIHSIRWGRRRIDFKRAIAVEIAEFDFMHNRVSSGIELVNRETARAVGPEHRNDTLVVRRHRDCHRPIAVDITNFRVSHPTELSAEVPLPQRVAPTVGSPQLDSGHGPAEREDALDATTLVDHRFVEDIAVGIFDEAMRPAALFRDEHHHPGR